MSVCDPVTGMHHIFSNVLAQQVFTESPRCGFNAPWDDEYIADFENTIKNHHESLAAVILEPIVQGTGGMKIYSPEFLKRVRALCDQHQVLLIADEIATGFGRTGKMFACDHANISPDIMCLGKALTGGYLSLAATLCSSDIANTISAGESGVFMHGPTFMGNPLACALANKSINMLRASPWQQKITQIEELFNCQLPKFLELPQVAEVRCIGAIGVIELHNPVDMKKILPMFIDHNIWLRPFGKLVYTLPPYIITDDELTQLLDATFSVVKQI